MPCSLPFIDCWMEESADYFHKLIAESPYPAGASGHQKTQKNKSECILFIDGLRFDRAKHLVSDLSGKNYQVEVRPVWSALPTLTATCKPAVSPVKTLIAGKDLNGDFEPVVRKTGQPLKGGYHFRKLLAENGWTILDESETGDGNGSAWCEFGDIDHEGHQRGWKLALLLDSYMKEIMEQIELLFQSGWKSILIVTDHGWLLMPGGLPKTDLPDALFGRTPRALNPEEIQAIIRAFAGGIGRAEKAGFDGVQLHAAHGWLLSSFLSPHTNKRDDEYGGSTENRTRIIREIYELGRSKVSPDFPILIKLNTTDFFPDGTNLPEAVDVVRILDKTGFSAFETSGGMWETVTRGSDELGWPAYMLPESRTGLKNNEQEAYFLAGALAVKSATHKPVMLVGGVKSFSRMEEILTSGQADFLSMSRPLIRQPDLPDLLLSGQRDKADCISCNACLGTAPLRCGALKNN